MISQKEKVKLYEEIQESSTVTFVPEKDFPLKTKASLKANGFSKDASNPLIPVALGKSKLVDLTKTSPVANGSGKGLSNPLIPVALEKSKMTVLSTSPDANGTGKGNSNPLSPVALGKSKMTILSKLNPFIAGIFLREYLNDD